MRSLAPLLLLSMTACIAGLGYSTLDQVSTAAREYNEDVRWGRFDKAAAAAQAAQVKPS